MNYIHWLSLGLGLVLLEFFIPGTYVIWFGFAALIMVGVVSFVALSATQQVIVFSVIAAICAIIGLYVYKKLMNLAKVAPESKNLNNPAAQYIGRRFKLVQDVVDGRSKVSIGDTVWLVECEDNLKSGDDVKITGIKDGVILTAQKPE